MELPDAGILTRRCPAREVQLLWQDAALAFNPRFTVRDVLEEPARIARRLPPEVRNILTAVGLPEDAADRRTAMLSGGQKARLALARALEAHPRVVILDESLSGLDDAARRRMTDLLSGLRTTRGLAVVLITHDLELATLGADRVVVMGDGRVIEEGTSEDILRGPNHPETRRLIDAIPGGRV
jgi:peptide/nickel transport system ATP-binding protein